jgi:D-proline reductase (dithiol) PrdB
VCHQTVGLVSRHLEAEGIPTVVMGAAKDIVETVGVARFAFSDVPLGNSAGLPFDEASQRVVLECALRLLEAAPGPRTTWQTPVRWGDGDHSWKRDFNNPASLTEAERAEARRRFEEQKQLAARRANPVTGQVSTR